MKDQNEVKLSGVIDRVRRIDTKTGNSMAEIILVVSQSRFRVTAFGNVGQRLLTCVAGERVAITGSLATSAWRDKDSGEWKNSWGITAWGADIDGEVVRYQRQEQQASHREGENIPTPPPGAIF
jgi:single-stranded DNA-binding protein